MTELKAKMKLALAFTLAAGLLAHPVLAQTTEEKLEAAKARLKKVEAEATRAAAEYERGYQKLVVTGERIENTKVALRRSGNRMEKFEARLNQRAAEAYVMGTSSTFELLLESNTMSEFSDRVVFLNQLAQDDEDLVVRVSVTAEELRRKRADLRSLAVLQRDTVADLEKKKKKMYGKLSEAQAIREKWADQLEAEERAAAQLAATSGGSGSTGTVQGQALQACPVPGSSFVDSWGAPRSGGRSHQGVDMMAGYGTPVYAAQSGRVAHSSSSLGGNTAYVYGDGGDTTMYMHNQGYSDVGAGQHVSAGTLIAYVGDTGNATGSPHVHFEYHPGGGGAVNPYPYVAAVC